jgi:hypothetical protein
MEKSSGLLERSAKARRLCCRLGRFGGLERSEAFATFAFIGQQFAANRIFDADEAHGRVAAAWGAGGHPSPSWQVSMSDVPQESQTSVTVATPSASATGVFM